MKNIEKNTINRRQIDRKLWYFKGFRLLGRRQISPIDRRSPRCHSVRGETRLGGDLEVCFHGVFEVFVDFWRISWMFIGIYMLLREFYMVSNRISMDFDGFWMMSEI